MQGRSDAGASAGGSSPCRRRRGACAAASAGHLRGAPCMVSASSRPDTAEKRRVHQVPCRASAMQHRAPLSGMSVMYPLGGIGSDGSPITLTRHHCFICKTYRAPSSAPHWRCSSAISCVLHALLWPYSKASSWTPCTLRQRSAAHIILCTTLTLPHLLVSLRSYSVAKGGENSGSDPSCRLPASDRRPYFCIQVTKLLLGTSCLDQHSSRARRAAWQWLPQASFCN